MERYKPGSLLPIALLAQILLVLLFVPAIARPAPQETGEGQDSPAGRWEGTLTLPSTQLQFSVELWRSSDGWGGAISIPAQNLEKYPLNAIELEKGRRLSFAMRGIPGDPIFGGTLSEDGLTVEGQLQQSGMEVPFKMEWKGEAAPPESPDLPDAESAQLFLGSWEGALDSPAGRLRLRVHLKANPDGKVEATLDSPDQRQNDLPIQRVEVEGRTIRLHLDYIRASFEGELSEDGKRIEGSWRQGGGEIPLVLEPYSDSSGPGESS